MEPSQVHYEKYLYLIRRRLGLFLLIALLLMTALFVLIYLLPKKYEATSTFLIERTLLNQLVRGNVAPSNDDTLNVVTTAITSRNFLKKVVASLEMDDEVIGRIKQGIAVKVKERNQFTISFLDKDPVLARDAVNTLIRLYKQELLSAKQDESSEAAQFLSDRIAAVTAQLAKTESEINAYQRQNGGIMSIDEAKLFDEINAAQQKLYDLQLRRRQLEGMRQLTRSSNDPIQAKLVALQSRLDDLRALYTETYPEVVSVKNEIEALKEQLRSHQGGEQLPMDPQELGKINSEIHAIEVTEEELRRFIGANRNVLQRIPSAKAGLEQLEMERKNQKTTYEQLYARHGQSELSKQMEVQDKSTSLRVIDPAVLPLKPVSPNRPVLMLLAIVGSIAASLGFLVLLDTFDRSVKGVESVKGLGLPVLAVIPKLVEPAKALRQRRRMWMGTVAAAVYFLLLLSLPAMELLGLPYLDRFLDQLSSGNAPQGAEGALLDGNRGRTGI